MYSSMYWAEIHSQEIRLKWSGHVLRRICEQETGDDGGAGGKKERKTEAEVVG